MKKCTWTQAAGGAAATAMAVALLGGCAADRGPMIPASGPAKPATGPACAGNESPVTINQVSIPASGTSGSIGVAPGRLNIGKNAAGVHWKFSQGNRFAFTSDGITFKPGSPAGPGAAAPSSDLSEYRWCFNATSGDLEWPYTIKFYEVTAPTRVWSCDPIIANFDGLMLLSQTVNCTLSP